jgi:hypothetical protein
MKVNAAPSFFESIKRINSLGNKIRGVWYWIRMHTKKRFLRVLKATLKSYPYDSAYLLDIEQAKINEIADYMQLNQSFVGWEYTVRDLRICSKLIDILKNETNYFHFDGNLNFVPIEKTDEKGESLMEVKPSNDFKYVCDINVNMKNIDRFLWHETERNLFENQPHELYLRKARCLYHKIRAEREEEWWD